jgi:hypothetical protein
MTVCVLPTLCTSANAHASCRHAIAIGHVNAMEADEGDRR